MRTRTKRTLTTAIVTVVLLGGGVGAAIAYWSAGGTGTGSGDTGTSLAVNAEQTSTITDLRPGGSAQAISGTFDNLNDAPTYVSTLTVAITGVTGGAGACDASDYTLANPVVTVNATVDDGTAWSGPTIAFNNKVTNQDGCKGATVSFGFTVA
jgi:hypothetical protein